MSATVDTSQESMILTIDEAAAYLAIPKATLCTWRARRVGFGPRAVKMGGCLRYRRADLDAWIVEHLEPAEGEWAMARPRLPLGTWGTLTTEKIRDGYRALTRFRDTDGNTRRVTATGPSKAAAERALRDVLGARTAPAGEFITAETRLIDLANLWIGSATRIGDI